MGIGNSTVLDADTALALGRAFTAAFYPATEFGEQPAERVESTGRMAWKEMVRFLREWPDMLVALNEAVAPQSPPAPTTPAMPRS